MDRNDQQPFARITALEERLTHFEQQFDQLNEVVLAQRREIDKLSGEVARSRAAIEHLERHADEDLPHEKPPHY